MYMQQPEAWLGAGVSSTVSGVFRKRSPKTVGFLALNNHECGFEVCILIFLQCQHASV